MPVLPGPRHRDGPSARQVPELAEDQMQGSAGLPAEPADQAAGSSLARAGSFSQFWPAATMQAWPSVLVTRMVQLPCGDTNSCMKRSSLTVPMAIGFSLYFLASNPTRVLCLAHCTPTAKASDAEAHANAARAAARTIFIVTPLRSRRPPGRSPPQKTRRAADRLPMQAGLSGATAALSSCTVKARSECG